jgi:hypothetical protein
MVARMTPAARAVFDRCQGGEDGVSVEHLTSNERQHVAVAMGWDTSAEWVRNWIRPWVAPKCPDAHSSIDYEGAILDEADRKWGDYL